MTQSISSSFALIEALRQHQLLGQKELNELILGDLQGRFADPRDLAREMLLRGWLTAYQVNQLLQGNAADLIVSHYLILERLGEGGTGQVFKARHRHMGRLVALKVLRKALVNDREMIGRFQREVKVISQLTHPNVVRAHDAGPLGAGYFLAMEYVEGTNLAHLVKNQGRLGVAQAADYVRQAALGLQYIHERGLVHRDIKPSNLFLTQPATSAKGGPNERGAIIKILDLGLARMMHPVDSDATEPLTADNSSALGTIDYMAPEQALDFHHADIRADVYSLGCTFYFLLAGAAPFGSGTVAQKLIWHQNREPAPVEEVRRDVPPYLLHAVRRMMNKDPGQRYQLPEEVVRALSVPPTAIPIAEAKRPIGGSAPLGVLVTAAPPSSVGVSGAPLAVPSNPLAAPPHAGAGGSPRRRRKLAIAAFAALLLVVTVVSVLPSRKKDAGDAQANADKQDKPISEENPPPDRADLLNLKEGQFPTDTGSDAPICTLLDNPQLGKFLQVEFRAGDSFGDRVARVTNWKPFLSVEFVAFNTSKETLRFSLNVKHSRSTDYQTRVVMPFELKPGRSHVRLGITEMVNVNGSPADLANVVRWYIASEDKKASTIYFGNFSLESSDVVIQGKPYVRDALLNPDQPTKAYGTEKKDNAVRKGTTLSVFLIWFDVDRYAPALRRKGIDKATLSFFVWDPSNQGRTKVQVCPILTPWDEATATWQQAGAGKPWRAGKSPGAGDVGPLGGASVVVEPDKDKETDTVDPPLRYHIDVTDLVRLWVAGQANTGLAILPVPDASIDNNQQTRFQIFASEHERPQYGPKLRVLLKQ